MGFDAMANDASSPASRDARKKRGNRSAAKLKQCKLDARREQWLSQVKDGKEVKAAASSPTARANAGSPVLLSPHPPLPRRRAEARLRGGALEENDREEADGSMREVGSSDPESPTHNSPISGNSRGCCPQRKCSGNVGGGHSVSSASSAWSSSRSVSDVEDEDSGGGHEEEDNGVLDDWEAVADALSVDNNHSHQSSGPTVPPAAPTACAPPGNVVAKPEPSWSRTRAWRPDDEFRPQSLPSLSKQASFPATMGTCWMGIGMGAPQKGVLSLPMSCPICYEDLDPTDSSFLPCPCGFHLCLFCHKRILEADGRCPGCRKQYNTMPVGGGADGNGQEMANVVPMRLSRSCSMGPRC